jgi:hypothetical protein
MELGSLVALGKEPNPHFDRGCGCGLKNTGFQSRQRVTNHSEREQ